MFSNLRRIYEEIEKKVVEYLEKLCSLDYTVILFGSRARGDYRPDSDWDVLVIGYSEPEKPLLPINMFFYKPSELDKNIENFNTIVIDAFYEGKLLCDNLGIYDKYRGRILGEIKRRKLVKSREGWFPARK
ncbi:MAG: nucleotidyltransferase domain-containing protein [Thermoprotei archaeon]